MLKKDTLGSASNKSLTEAFRCGDCLHFRQHPHSTRQKVCIDEGVKAVAIAPSCFTPDVTALIGNSDQFVQLAMLFQAYTPKQRKIILGLLRSKKKKYTIGTKLYFKVGADFVSNYLAGYVAGYTSVGELMLIGSPDEKTRGSTFTTYMTSDAEGLLTVTEWKVKRAQLRDQNLIHDPANKVIKKSSVVDAYEPPTIDAAPKEWYDSDKKKKAPVNKGYAELSFNVV